MTLELVLGKETCMFYGQYFADINKIVTSIMADDGINNRVNFKTYYKYTFNLFMYFLKDDKDRNKIIESTIVIIYDSHYC